MDDDEWIFRPDSFYKKGLTFECSSPIWSASTDWDWKFRLL